MANHLAHPVRARRNEVVVLAFRVNFPTAPASSGVIAPGHGNQGVSLSSPGTGRLTVTLAEAYNQILAVSVAKVNPTTTNTGYWRVTNATSGTDGRTFELVHGNDAGTASDPGAGSAVYVTVVARNSSTP